jgi:hypothetical protein
LLFHFTSAIFPSNQLSAVFNGRRSLAPRLPLLRHSCTACTTTVVQQW